MDIEQFEYSKRHFPYELCALYWNEHSWKRDEFVKHFTRDKIANMTIEEYVVGFGDTTTYCYGLWRGLMRLANISSAFPTAFGVYYNQKKKSYVADKARWLDPDKAFEQMKSLILELIDAGEKEDLETLANNPINSMVKGKILCTYFPSRYISICAENHIDYYMKAYDLYNNSTKSLNPVYKRELLLDFKNNDTIMKKWTLDQYAFFMWDVFPKSPGIRGKEKNKKASL